MKFLVVVVLFAVLAAAVNAANIDLPESYKEKAKQYITECRAEFVINDEEYAKLKSGEIVEPSENVKCLTNCFQEKAGIVKDGVFQEATVLTKFSTSMGEEKTKQIIETCRSEIGSGKCETAYKLHQCFKKNNAY